MFCFESSNWTLYFFPLSCAGVVFSVTLPNLLLAKDEGLGQQFWIHILLDISYRRPFPEYLDKYVALHWRRSFDATRWQRNRTNWSLLELKCALNPVRFDFEAFTN